jgi:Flp pilus assembly pilin Flp
VPPPPARLAKEDGQTMAEYAVVTSVIVVGVVVALGVFGSTVAQAIGRFVALIP